MTMIAVGWICLGIGLAMGFTMGRWATESQDRSEPVTRAVNTGR